MAGTYSYSKDQQNQAYNQAYADAARAAGKSPGQLTPEERARAEHSTQQSMMYSTGETKNPTYGNVLGYTQNEVDRQRRLADAAAARQAYQQNYGGYDAAMAQSQGAREHQLGALGSQRDALGLQRSAALGEAPSAAQTLGRNMLDQSLQAQMAGASSARGGGLAQAAAMRQAQNQAAVQQAQGVNQLSALRAQEMAQARDSYAGGAAALSGAAGNLRQSDYGAAGLGLQRVGLESTNEYNNRQLNQQAQQYHEGQANNIYANQLQADLGVTGYDRTGERAADDRDANMINSAIGAAATTAGSLLAFASDMRAKEPLSPDDPLMTTTMGAQSGFAPGTPQFEAASVKAPPSTDEEAAAKARNRALGGAATGAISGLGSLAILSDESAKRAAFLEGAAFAVNPTHAINPATGRPALPDYVRKDAPKPDADVRDAELRRRQQFRREAPANLAAIADANRSMQGSPYAYKPGLTPPGQAPGEPNVGPMAQQMEKSPVAATAVKVDPATGLRFIDRDKALKVTMSGVASLQQQLDEMKASAKR